MPSSSLSVRREATPDLPSASSGSIKTTCVSLVACVFGPAQHKAQVVEFARAAKVEGTTQRIVYCSVRSPSNGNHPSHLLSDRRQQPLFTLSLYVANLSSYSHAHERTDMSSKAQTEKRLSELGYDETIVFKVPLSQILLERPIR